MKKVKENLRIFLEQWKNGTVTETGSAALKELENYANHPFVEIYGRRWFDRSAGNTYHTVQVFVDGQELPKTAMTYGYDSAYIDTAFKLLQKHGYFTEMKEYWDFEMNRRNNQESFIISVEDVTRRKDL